jgi:hypothetical protein
LSLPPLQLTGTHFKRIVPNSFSPPMQRNKRRQQGDVRRVPAEQWPCCLAPYRRANTTSGLGSRALAPWHQLPGTLLQVGRPNIRRVMSSPVVRVSLPAGRAAEDVSSVAANPPSGRAMLPHIWLAGRSGQSCSSRPVAPAGGGGALWLRRRLQRPAACGHRYRRR